jgi:hypothetical protein
MGPLASPVATAVVVAVTARWATNGLPDVAAAPLSVMVAGLAYVTVASATGVAEARSLITDLRGIRRRLVNR